MKDYQSAVLVILAGIGFIELRKWYYSRKMTNELVASLNTSKYVHVAIGSASITKYEAVKEIIYLSMPGATVRCFKASSNVSEQPMGHDETLQGATNRMNQACEFLMDDANYTPEQLSSSVLKFAVGIESGIIQINPELYVDVAWVVIRDVSSELNDPSCACSSGVPVPLAFVKKVKHVGLNSTTAGACIEKHLISKNRIFDYNVSKDPHRFLTNEFVKRQELIAQAFAIAFGQLHNKIVYPSVWK